MSARRGSRPARAAGFTLTELMIVVALVGVLTTLGIYLMRAKPRASDVASQLSSKIAEASRKAVATGAVRSDVATALASTARTRAVISVAARGGTIALERLEEDPAPADTASWVTLSVETLHPSITISGYKASADLTGGATAPDVALAAGASLEVRCYPDGRCDGMTIYLASDGGRRKARVVVMPLGGSPATFATW